MTAAAVHAPPCVDHLVELEADLDSGVAHDAHLGGMFAGLLLAQSRLRAKSGPTRQKEADDVAVR